MAESAETSPVEEGIAPTRTPKVDILKNFPFKEDIPKKKILFLGDESIGKTTFIKKYCESGDIFHICYGYTGSLLTFMQYVFYRSQDDKRFLIRLMEFPAGTTEESREEQYPDEVDSIVFCFTVDNPTSLANVWKTWLPESRKYFPEFSRIYLLGLRNDTREKMLETNKTPVTEERGSQIHQKYKFCGQYMECSVEANPQQAFDLLDTLISDVLSCDPPIVLV